MVESHNDRQTKFTFYFEQLNNKSITLSINSDGPMLNNRHALI